MPDKYKISVPFVVGNGKMTKEDILQCAQKVDAEYIFLSYSRVSVNMEKNKKEFKLLEDYIPYLKSFGFKVGVWIWSFWLTELNELCLEDEVMVKSNGEKRLNITPVSGDLRSSGFFCPTYEKSSSVMMNVLKIFASYNPDLILFDDDFDYATHNGCVGCFCDNHIKLFSERLGREFDRKSLLSELYSGKANDVRRNWYAFMGETLENHARKVRQAVDEVNPDVRVGLCSVMSIWGTDGTTAERIAKILAGNTRPFIRLIGAPYWAVSRAWGNRLQNIIELERMEYAWLEDKNGIDVFTEGDTYPRPRHTTPASYLECFDTALRAAKVANGIHKYIFDYCSNSRYEPTYVNMHLRNGKLYKEIDRIFSDKNPVGVRVYEYMNNISEADVSRTDNPEGFLIDQFHSRAARLLTDNTIPTTYEGKSKVGIAFGENARHLPESAFEGGLILDIRAARILMEKGIDVGIEKIGEDYDDSILYYPAEDDVIDAAYSQKSAYKIIPKANATTVVYSVSDDRKIPDTIHYVNENGTKFLVYSFDAAFVDARRYRNYYAQNQLFASLEWLSGEPLSAVCKGNPDLYILTSENESEFAIGLWNIFADPVFNHCIKLNREYTSAEFVNCTGRLDKNELVLSDIQPYGMAFIKLTK